MAKVELDWARARAAMAAKKNRAERIVAEYGLLTLGWTLAGRWLGVG